MSSNEIECILRAIEELKGEVADLKAKKINIEDIGIGSLVGWIKLTVGVALFVVTMAGTGYAMLSQHEALKTDYQAHMKYIHKVNPSGWKK